jgi:S-formylglutathione hydrolase FrmB
MRLRASPRSPLLALVLLLALLSPSVQADAPLQFQITLPQTLTHGETGGRLFVLMARTRPPDGILRVGFVPGETWLAAAEVRHVAPGGTIAFDPDALAYPKPFSQAGPGTWYCMALLDQDHNYAYHDQDADDFYGPIVTLTDADRIHPITLTLDRRGKPDALADKPSIKRMEFQSPLLSDFWGRPIVMRAGVVLPPGYDEDAKRLYPTVYHVHGYGGDETDAWGAGPRLRAQMTAGKIAPFVHVFLDASFPTGHTAFADSVNNGPWGRALTQDLIPALEAKFRLAPDPALRFLTGHSSGGWSTLWLQTTYPDFFGGTWSTSPDPVDFRSFTGVNATPGSTDNFYVKPDGRTPRNLVRMGGRDVASMEQFARQEQEQGEYGGQFASFEWVWSPRGEDGRPMPLFDRQTGRLDPDVLQAWQKYDIRRSLETNWPTLGPKLRGKLHIFVGSADTFHLEEGVAYLKDFFGRVGSDAVCEVIPGRSHFDLYRPYTTYPDGLTRRIDREMAAAVKAHEATAKR